MKLENWKINIKFDAIVVVLILISLLVIDH